MTDNEQQQDEQQQDEQQQDEQQQDEQQQDEQQQDEQQQDEQQQSFSRDYVQSLRSESAGYRKRMQRAERELFRMKVDATGLIVAADEVPFDAALLDDDDALTQQVEAIVTAKPYLKRRSATGNIGQHEQRQTDSNGPGLLGMLRHNA